MQRFFVAAIGRHIEKRATTDNLLRARNVHDFWQCKQELKQHIFFSAA